MNRAHRIGSQKTVNVYRLIMADTLEEKILGMQNLKLMVANTLVNEENNKIENVIPKNLFDIVQKEANQNRNHMIEASLDKDIALGLQHSTVKISNFWNLIDPKQYSEEEEYNEFDMQNFLNSLKST